MPHRILTLSEAAEYLHITVPDVERLVKHGEIPFELQREKPVFRRKQVDAWASQRILGMNGSRLRDFHKSSKACLRHIPEDSALIPELTGPRRMIAALTSRTKPSVLRDMVALAERTELVSDPADLLATLEERESLCSTAVPGGFALLHPRQHDPYLFAESFLLLARCVHPIHAGAPDGKPTDLFFLVCCQDDRIHLHTLTRLCTMSQNTQLLASLREAEDGPAMFACLCTAEQEVLRAR